MKKLFRYIIFCLLIPISSCEKDGFFNLNEWSIIIESNFHFSPQDIYRSNNGVNFLTASNGPFENRSAVIYSISDKGLIHWTYETETNISDLSYNDLEDKIIVLKSSTDSVMVSQINNRGNSEKLFQIINEYKIERTAQIEKLDNGFVICWFSKSGVSEYKYHIILIDNNGLYKWKREVSLANALPVKIVIYENELLLAYNAKNENGNVKIKITRLNNSGEIIGDFFLETMQLRIYERPWNLNVSEDHIYINSTNGGKSKISKHTLNGSLIGEIEIPFVNDIFTKNGYIWSIGNDGQHDADLGQGYPYIIVLNENLEILLESKFASFISVQLGTHIASTNSGAFVACLKLREGGLFEYDLFVANLKIGASL